MAKKRKQLSKNSKAKIRAQVTIKKPQKTGLKNFYLTQYKKLLLIPILLLLLSILSIGYQTIQTGEFVNKGVSLSGGISLTMFTSDVSIETLEADMYNEFGQIDFSIRKITSSGTQKALIIESAELTETQITSFVKEKYSLTKDDLTLEQTGSALGERFFQQTAMAILISLLFMGAVVFLYFRSIIPSIAIILAAVSDIIMTLAVFNILGMKLTTAGIAAFLMLIGYSVDTDILLSTRVLKRKEGTVNDRIMSALSTGLMMNITTLAAISIALIFSQSQVLTQIMTILFIGLIFDMINTWLQNVGILKLYLEHKGGNK